MRLILLSALPFTLAACATPDVMCDVRTDYAWELPEATEGVVTTRWMYGRDAYLPANVYGTTECWATGDERFCLVQMRGKPESYRNFCGMARVRHEEKHTMGAKHER